MDKLTELSRLCKGEVSISINEHRNSCCSVDEHLDFCDIDEEDVEEAVKNKMIETDTMVCIHFYPNTPVGYYSVYHYDVESALKMAIEMVYQECYDDKVVDEAVRKIYEEKEMNKKKQ